MNNQDNYQSFKNKLCELDKLRLRNLEKFDFSKQTNQQMRTLDTRLRVWTQQTQFARKSIVSMEVIDDFAITLTTESFMI